MQWLSFESLSALESPYTLNKRCIHLLGLLDANEWTPLNVISLLSSLPGGFQDNKLIVHSIFVKYLTSNGFWNYVFNASQAIL